MTDNFRIRRAEGKWVVRAAGAVIGETAAALELTEGDRPPVICFPREDVAMAFLERTEGGGEEPARYAIIAKSGPIADAARSWEKPRPGYERIERRIAFDPRKATVERV